MLYRTLVLTDAQAATIEAVLEQSVALAFDEEVRAARQEALEAVRNRLAPLASRLSMRAIAEEICEREHITLDDLRGPCRIQQFVRPRQEFCARAYETRQFSYPQIGRWLGGRDHTTVLHGHRRHRSRMADHASPMPIATADLSPLIGSNGGPPLEEWA